MRTKALLCAVALAAGLASTMAQVYSLNVVGYYNVTVAANAKQMIANQLNTTNNTIASLLPSVPGNSYIFKWDGSFIPYKMDDVDFTWSPDGNATLNPGEAAFFLSPVATTLTFVGEVLQGNLTTTLPSGIKVFRSSKVPQAGTITTALGAPGEANDYLFKWAGGSYDPYKFDDVDLIWTPTEPNLAVGEGFFYIKTSVGAASTTWTRNFTVQ